MNTILSQTALNNVSAAPVALDNQASTAVRPLTIALLGYRSHPFVGGQGIYIKYLSRALADLGHTVHVYSGQPYPELDEGIELIKVPSLNLYESDNHVRALRWHHCRSFANVYEWWTMLTGGFAEPYTFGRRVRKLLRNRNYDIVHDNQSLCTGLLDLQRKGHTVISTVHHPIHRDRQLAMDAAPNWGFRLLVKRWHSFLGMQEKVVRKLSHVITVSTQSQKDIAQFFRRDERDTPVFFNGVDTQLFRPGKATETNQLRILTTSSSDQPLKGLRYLLEATAKLYAVYPTVELHIIGKLQENGANAKLIDKLGLQNVVVTHSGISTEQLVEEYQRATVVVCPSLYEGFGLPAAEAMACGKPLVSSDGGALPEVVGDAGIVVKLADSQALYQAIDKLWNNKHLRDQLATRARRRALNTFCWSRVADDLTAYYHQCIRSNPKSLLISSAKES